MHRCVVAQAKTLTTQAFIKSDSEDVESSFSNKPVEEQPAETTTPASDTKSVEETSTRSNLLIGALILVVIAGAYLYMRKRQS